MRPMARHGSPLRRVLLSLFASACGLLLALSAAVSAQPRPSAPGTWDNRAPAPSKRTEVAAAVLKDQIFVVGGFSEPSLSNFANFAITDAVEVYDPATDRWTIKPPLPARRHHAGAAAVGNRLYVVGGFTTSFLSIWSPVPSVYAYDPSSESWTEVAPLPTARGALAVAELGGKLYAVGGYAEGGNTGALEVFDPATDRWESKAPLPTPRDHLAAAAVGGRLYAIGGRLDRNYGRNLAVVEAYDPVMDRWTPVAPLPTARSGIAAAVIGETIYVVGGEAPEGTFRTNEAYSPAADRWQTVAPLPTGRHGLGAATVNDELYAIAGGPTPGGSFSNRTERYVPGPIRASRRASRPSGRAEERTSGPISARTPAGHVSTVMALLAAFHEAGVLPPESIPDANRLIRALIQFQSAFMKSTHPAIRQLLVDAFAHRLGAAAPAAVERFRADGWTSESLEAVIDYVADRPIWDHPGPAEGFRAYNVGRTDFQLLSRIFFDARARLARSGQDIHRVYAKRRREMSGGNL